MSPDEQDAVGPNHRMRKLLLNPGTWAGMAIFLVGYLIPILAFPDSVPAVAVTAITMTIAVLLSGEVIPDVE